MSIGIRRVQNKMTNRRVGEEWYNCAKCYTQRPRHEMVAFNGQIVCRERCIDAPGASALRAKTEIRTEQSPLPLPEVFEDL